MDSNTKEGLVWFIASLAVLGVVGAVTISYLDKEKASAPAPLTAPEEAPVPDLAVVEDDE